MVTPYFVMKTFDVFLDRVNELGLVFLDGATNLKRYHIEKAVIVVLKIRTLGRTNRALNLEKTRNISLALRAVPSRSRKREIIWFSTRATRSV